MATDRPPAATRKFHGSHTTIRSIATRPAISRRSSEPPSAVSRSSMISRWRSIGSNGTGSSPSDSRVSSSDSRIAKTLELNASPAGVLRQARCRSRLRAGISKSPTRVRGEPEIEPEPSDGASWSGQASRSVPKLRRRSGRPPVVVQEASESRFSDDLPCPIRFRSRFDHPVREPLVIALRVVMLDELPDGNTELPLRKEDHSAEALLFNGADEPLGVCVEVRAAGLCR